MITRLILENFLAHGHTELDFGPGVTVISGPNNSGKSSIVEALRCLAQNPSPKFFIRHGAKEARVTVEVEDGTRVTWVRRPKYALYEVMRPGAEKPETYAKFGRRPPEDVLNLLRLENVVLEGMSEDVDVHLGDQRRPVFLLDRPGSAMASFFASSTEATHLVAMQQLLKTRMTQARSDEKRLATAMVRAGQVLDGLYALPLLRREMEIVREKAALAGKLRARVPVLETRLEKMREHVHTQTTLQERCALLVQTHHPPVPESVDALAVLTVRMQGLQKKQHRLQIHLRELESLRPQPEIHPVTPLRDILGRRRVLLDVQVKKTDRCTALRSLISCDEPVPTVSLDHITRQMTRLDASVAGLEKKSLALEPLVPAGEPRDIFGLQGKWGALLGLEKKCRYLMEKGDALLPLHEVPALDVVHGLISQIDRIQTVLDSRNRISLRLEQYSPLHPEPVVEWSAGGERLLQQLEEQLLRLKKGQKKRARLAHKEEELRSRLETIDICPLCGGPVDVDRVLKTGRT